jgi:predicted dehydrogenase
MPEIVNPKISDIVVVGGGRWGLIICSVLQRLLHKDVTIWLQSQHLPADRVPDRLRRVFDLESLCKPVTAGAAVIATAPADHANSATRLLSAGWHVLVEKPVALSLRDALAIAETATRVRREAWSGLVYLFAPYLSIMKPYAADGKRWLLEWHEQDEEMRWGELKSTPHHVNIIEDIFPHAWSILRAAGLAAPLHLQKISSAEPQSVQLDLRAGQAKVELHFCRCTGRRRRTLKLETSDSSYMLDFSEEPGTFKIDGKDGKPLPWNPDMRPLAIELSTFIATCSGQSAPNLPVAISQSLEAVALMEKATEALLKLQAQTAAVALCGLNSQTGYVQVLFDALCREAAMAGLRLDKNSKEEQALTMAADAFMCGHDDAFDKLPDALMGITRESPFLARFRRERDMILVGSE